ncbi:MAG: HAD family hydrolase, partial [Actinomycetota bacterium]|nr:HAD family hydrolase [Actinomycetota bacterium]
MTSPRPAVLFDIDGTLLDTNWFHTVSWWQAFQEAGEDIPMSR